MVAIPVDDKQGEHHERERQQGADHNQFIPVCLHVDLLRRRLAGQDDALLLLNVWCARVTNQSSAFLAGLRPHTVVRQQLTETLFLRPALIGLGPVCLSHHHQVSLRGGIEKLAGGVTIAPSPLCQVGPQLTGQNSECVRRDSNELAVGATYKKQLKCCFKTLNNHIFF